MAVPEGISAGEYEWVAALYRRGSWEALSNQSNVGCEPFNVRVTIATNSSTFRPDGHLTASASVWNFGPDVDLDLYIAMMLPDGFLLYLPSFDAEPMLYYALRRLLTGTECEDVPVLEATIPSGLMLGNYCFFAAFFEPDTPTLYGIFTTACWELRE